MLDSNSAQKADDSPSVTAEASGTFILAWESKGVDQADSFGIFTAQFDSSGNALTGQTLVNTYTPNDQLAPSVASAGGRAVYLWGGQGPDGNQEVMLCTFNVISPGFTIAPVTALTTTESGGQASFTVALSVAPMANVTIALSLSDPTAATLSTTTNSNNINVIVGLLVPAALLGLGTVTAATTLTAWWYLGLTLAVLAWMFVRRGLGRLEGALIVIAYVVFVVQLLR